MPGVVAEEQPNKARKPTKNELRRAKKKQQKKEGPTAEPQQEAKSTTTETPQTNGAPTEDPRPSDTASDKDLDIDDFGVKPSDKLLEQFSGVFARFAEGDKQDAAAPKEPEKPKVFYDDDNIQDEEEEEATRQKLSKKSRKAANKLSIAELKAAVKKPETVEWTDVSAPDPKLLISIKSARNVVPVPTHWSLKREYLSSKRGIEKPPWALPKFIAETGIGEMRDAVLEKQAEQSLKQQQRARVQPKMGKLDIDYQKLYEAFFRRQTKPALTRYGEVYYEGKEYETNLRHLRPGELSDELREALNIPPGAPPPWLINMQKIGPPPSYPALKIPGVNAPPPPGGAWGFQPGGWGKPPLNEEGKPAYGGDVFGHDPEKKSKEAEKKPQLVLDVVDKSSWGELMALGEEEPEEEEEEEEEDDDDEEEEQEVQGREVPYYGGVETPSGITSTIPTDFGPHASNEDFDLRKKRRGIDTEEPQGRRSAGTVLKERNIRVEGFFGGDRAYDLGNQRPNMPVLGQEPRGSKRKAGDLDVSVDVDALQRDGRLSKDELKKQYEAQRAQEGGGGWKGTVDSEDLSGMVQEEMVKRQKRDQERRSKR